MPTASLRVDPKSLVKTSVSMDAIADQLTALRGLIDQHCHLAPLALGGVGAIACARYNSDCDDAATAAGTLQDHATALATTLGKNAVGYVSADDANLQAIEKAAETADPAIELRDWALTLLPGTRFSQLGARLALLKKTNAASGAVSAVTTQLKEAQAATTSLLEEARDTGSMKWVGFAMAASNAEDTVARRQAEAVAKLSRLEVLGAQTDSVLRLTSAYNITATAASLLWAANAVVTGSSDEEIDKAIGSWYGIHAGAQVIFGTWMPAIRATLFPDWTGAASTAAERQFASLMDDGTAFVQRAEKMAVSLDTVVHRLNDVYQAACDFATAQFAIIFAVTMASLFNPGALVMLKYLGLALRTSVTIAINAILVVLGLLSAWI